MRRRASPAGRRRSDTRYRLACTPPHERCRPAPGRESGRVVRFARWPATAAKRCRPQATSTKTCSTSPGVALATTMPSIDCIGDSLPVPESHPVCARWAVAAANRGYLALSPPCPCCSTGTRARGGGSADGRCHLGGHRPPTLREALSRSEDSIGTGHMLLALLNEEGEGGHLDPRGSGARPG
jgi:hypothetical protein